MFRPGADENNIQPQDIICDFCQHEWTEQRPMVEGHRGATICGNCLSAAYLDVVSNEASDAPVEFTCTMCRESRSDRAALHRENELGWQSPAYPGSFICRRCIKQAAGVLQKDPDFGWTKPQAG